MEQVTGSWSIHCWVECPHCTKDIDFTDEDEWYYLVGTGETKEFTEPYEKICPKCKETFQIIGTEY